MSKKLSGNGLWESTRMMLPQHKEQILEHDRRYNKRVKPLLHEDEWELIIQNISLSHSYTEDVEIEIFGEYGNKIISGVVTSVSQYAKKLKIECDDGYEWVDFDELISVRLIHEVLRDEVN
ncbi:YolD-like family protein [Paenibacillus sp. Dod16]|uniref:YolD-like family protein n=1 Tax=Paenibacillus sp. Dod16 TaxID=3416392 RepID=UPI003CF6886B